MLGKNIIRKSITTLTVAAIWSVYSMVAFAVPADVTGEITVNGQVTVNGQQAVSNSTILSGAVITTGQSSSAVISLGKLGRVELSGSTTATVRFADNTIIVSVDSGKITVANNAGVATTVTSKNATFMADASQADNFAVEVECSHTHIDTTAGVVTMREGTTDRQVAAGSTAVAGNLAQPGCKPCLRPNSTPPVAVLGWPWLLLLAAGGAAAYVLFGNSNSDSVQGNTIVVSPNR
ncbi:MAG: hypothetical protein JO053_15680 [Acidobacteria bacterium]|nr:hypothetical protein [Acidobacteriota bacterium]